MIQELSGMDLPNTQKAIKLKEICIKILDAWVALNLAFENGACLLPGTPKQIVELFGSQLAIYIYNCEVDVDDIVECLEIYLEKHFNLIIDDRSHIYIANRLLELYQDLSNQSDKLYEQLLKDIEDYKEQNKHIKHYINVSSDEDDDDDDDQQVQEQQPQNQDDDRDYDSDGFQIVKSKSRHFQK
ncbi:hypothetical protein pb186bvf_012078 [Paramecium bursaria]